MTKKKWFKPIKLFVSRLNKMSPLVVLTFLITPMLFLALPMTAEKINTQISRPALEINLPDVAAMPIGADKTLPDVSAKNVFILDLNSKMVLYSKNADQKVYPASTTKMITALVALDHFPLDQIITVSREYDIGTTVGFQAGEQINVEQLLYALLVHSGNDAAEILAENYAGGRQAFIEAMNIKATQIHLLNTQFVNPHGIDEDGHYSTASDLARLGDYALRNTEFSRIVATENAVVTSTDYATSHILNNVNQLLGKIPGVRGIKTGYTEGAGQALVTLVERESHPVIIVVLGSTDRFFDSAELIEWVYDNFHWEVPSPK
jgi:serine-type D-Ala-D-Ala carboxypeptidase (penicillin-binding protein 5/6)